MTPLASALALALASIGAPLELTWRAPSECPGASEVEARVQSLVGGRFEGPPRLRAEADVLGRGPPWSLMLALRTRNGVSERRLEADDCKALAEAAAVILALAVDRAPPVRIPLVPTPPSEAGGAARRPPLRLSLGSAVRGGTGHLPGLALGAILRVAVEVPQMRIGLGLGAWLPQNVGTDRRQARVGLLVGEVRLGHDFDVGPLELGPELVVELGRLEALGLGPDLVRASIARAVHLSAGAGLDVGVEVFGPLWARVRLELHVALARPDVVIEGVGSLFRVAPLSSRVEGGLEVRLP